MTPPDEELLRAVEHWDDFKELAHEEALSARGDDLFDRGRNGVRLALVDIPAELGDEVPLALIREHELNDLGLDVLGQGFGIGGAAVGLDAEGEREVPRIGAGHWADAFS